MSNELVLNMHGNILGVVTLAFSISASFGNWGQVLKERVCSSRKYLSFAREKCDRPVGNIQYAEKILKFGTPQTIAIIVLKLEKFDVTLH